MPSGVLGMFENLSKSERIFVPDKCPAKGLKVKSALCLPNEAGL